MWTSKPNGDQNLLLAGGFINISIQYIYNDRPGLRVVAAGVKNVVFPDIYSDETDAKRDAEDYAKKIFEQLHTEVNHLQATRAPRKGDKK
jgi:hypothetical protein